MQEINQLSQIYSASYVPHLLLAAGAGAMIGLERQLRHSAAGLRTNALVALGAALFTGIPTLIISPSTDLLRITSTVVTGIGFLGGGILLKEGDSVKGVDTAATLWCSAAVGSLAGLGLWKVALFGTGIVLLINSILRLFTKGLDKLSVKEDTN